MRKELVVAALGLLTASCGLKPNGSAEMLPGHDCFACHGTQGDAKQIVFSVAGTLYDGPSAQRSAGVAGATVTITDAAGKVLNLVTNRVGNFYSREPLTRPLKGAVTRGGVTAAMSRTVDKGGCASCHTLPASDGAPGRLYLGN